MIAAVDGCRGGWLLVKSSSWPCVEIPTAAICPNFSSVLQLTSDCSFVCVDIPIGLPSGRQIRQCDIEARELLGPQGQTRVFLAPPRECLNEVSPEDFQNSHRKCRDKGAGLPVWGLLKKIKEVDDLMTSRIQAKIIEFHPELAWWRTGGRTLDSKHQQIGISQREEILGKHIPGLDELLRWKDRLGSAAKVDDLLDALIGLSVAERVRAKAGCFVPASTESDVRGLTMKIWY